MELRFRSYQPSDYQQFCEFVFALYEEDKGAQAMTLDKIDLSIQTLREKRELGSILIFEHQQKLIGYAILINYWSNEYGGNIIHLDEIFIAEDFRSKGLASQFIQYMYYKNKGLKAIQLEVIPQNERALNLYLKLGFQIDKNKHLIFEI